MVSLTSALHMASDKVLQWKVPSEPFTEEAVQALLGSPAGICYHHQAPGDTVGATVHVGGLTPVCCEAGGASPFPNEEAIRADGVQGVHQANVVAAQALGRAAPRPASSTLSHVSFGTCTAVPMALCLVLALQGKDVLLPGLQHGNCRFILLRPVQIRLWHCRLA